MADNLIQTSFAAGELAPSIFARTDFTKYHSGAARMRNFFVDYRSGASTRPGTEFIRQAFKSATAVRLIQFQYSVIASYVLEFGDLYVRFTSNGQTVLETGFAITGATQANPVVLTVVGNNFVTGDWIFVTGIAGMTQLNGRYFQVTVAGNAVTLADVNGVPINGLGYSAWTSGGTASRVYTLTSPYAAADLALLKFSQSASVMTITHPSYAPRNLVITNPTSWAFNIISFATPIAAPVLISVAGTAGAVTYGFAVTSVDVNGQESGPSTPIVQPNLAALYTNTTSVSVAWNAVTGAEGYNVYMAEPNAAGTVAAGAHYGFVGQADGVAFTNTNILPNFEVTPPKPTNPFAAGNNPIANVYFQQRQVFLGSVAHPLTLWMSVTGGFTPANANFNVSDPIQPDDAITATLVSSQVNAIKSAISLPGGLIILTAKGAWQVNAGQGLGAMTPITPESIVAVPQAYSGASDVPPIVANLDVLYVQAKGSIVRDLSYNIYANIYTGVDISILSNHLFYGYQITEWAYAEEPFKIVWAIRDDGVMLSLTYVKEQEMVGWARHDTLGQFMSVATVTEDQVDAPYFVVKRYIGGRWVQMIERMAERLFVYGAEDAWSVDCGIQSVLPTPAAGLTISASTGLATFTADAQVFSAGSVGSVIRADGGIATITTFISTTVVQATWTLEPTMTLPNDLNDTPLPVASGDWSMTAPSTTFTGLDYLEGQTVSILADGGVVTAQVVTNASITLDQPASKVTIGLGFQAQLQTMYLDTGQPTIQGKRKRIAQDTLRVAETRGLKVGRTFDTLVPVKELQTSTLLGQPIPLITQDIFCNLDPLYDLYGQVCIQQDDPLPATILGDIREYSVGDTTK